MKKLSLVLLHTIADELDREDAEIVFDQFLSYNPELTKDETEFLENYIKEGYENKNWSTTS